MADFKTAFSVANTLFAALNSSLLKEVFSAIGYESDLHGLKKTVKTIKSVLLDAGNKKVLSETELDYILKLKDAVYDADDLFDEFLTLTELKQLLNDGSVSGKVRDFFSSKNPLRVAYSMSRDIKKIRKKLNDIADDRAKYEFSVDTQTLKKRREETHSFVHEYNVIGREDDASEVIHMLLDSTEDVGFLSIVGVGGLGKTTLAKLVFGDKIIESEFLLRLWVCVSDQDGAMFGVKEMLSKILESLRRQIDHSSSIELIQSEYRRSLGGKRFLLVLDDIWTENKLEWQKLQEFLMIGGRGSRIIVTTRSKETARIIGNVKYELKGLSLKNTWRLFEMMAFVGESKPKQFVEIGEKIVKKCSNLPLAIKVAGSLLCDQPINKWQAFETSGFAGNRDDINEIMSILKFSYDNLEPSLKSCFAYCALFPKDFVIQKEMLLNLWEAQGYIVPFEEGQSIENAGEEYISILLQRCFFQDVTKNECGDIKSFKIHDLMHDLAQNVAQNEICVVYSNMSDLENTVRHLYEARDNIEDDSFTKSKNRSYLMFGKNGVHDVEPFPVGKIADNWVCLRALALVSLRIRSLPDTIGNLLHLRYLNLAFSLIKELPGSIAKLHNLQTLNLSNCRKLTELPNNLCKLVNLSHLYTENCLSLTYMPVGMSKLSRLRVLTDFVVEDESADGIQRVGQLKDLKAFVVNLKGSISIHFRERTTNVMEYEWTGGCLDGSEHLQKLEICFPSMFAYKRHDEDTRVKEEVVMEKLQPHPNLKMFKLFNFGSDKIASWAQCNWATLLPNLVYIKLWKCFRLQQLPLLSKLIHLKSLDLYGLANLHYVEEEAGNSGWGSLQSECKTTFFPSLLYLEIRELDELQGWWGSRSLVANESNVRRELAFPRLSQLIINGCPFLTSFPPCPSLLKLELQGNNEALRITTGEVHHSLSSPSSSCEADDKLGISAELDYMSSLNLLAPRLLTSLNIRYNHKIVSLMEVEELFQNYSSFLRDLTIDSCDKLESLIGGLEHLTNLHSLSLGLCRELKLEEEEGNDDMPWKPLHQNLRSLTLKRLYNVEILPNGMKYLTSLQHLQIDGCSNLKVLPEWINCFQSLQSLHIINCTAIKSLPRAMLNLTSLQELKILRCPHLKELCQPPNESEWSKVQHVPHISIQ